MVFLEQLYPVLLIIHLAGAFALAGAVGHSLCRVIRYFQHRFENTAREFMSLKIALGLYVFVYIVGMAIYPYFRVHIRAAYFDKVLPWATGLFEIKEHLSSFGLAILIAAFVLRKNFDPAKDRRLLKFYIPLILLVCLVMLYQVVVGPYLVMIKGSK